MNQVLEIAQRLAPAGCKMPHPDSLIVSERMLNLSALFDFIGNIAAAGCFKSLAAEVAELEKEVARLEALVYVPGVFRCAKCKFELVSKVLYVRTGQVGANDRPQDCPNGHGPLWRVSERDYREELFEQLLLIRNETLELAAEIADTYRGVEHAAAPIAAGIRGRKTEEQSQPAGATRLSIPERNTAEYNDLLWHIAGCPSGSWDEAEIDNMAQRVFNGLRFYESEKRR